MISSHGANPIFFNRVKERKKKKTLTISHFCLNPLSQSGHHMCITPYQIYVIKVLKVAYELLSNFQNFNLKKFVLNTGSF